MAPYILTQAAQRDLDSIRGHLAGAPPAIREQVIDAILATFRQAVQFPESGRIEPKLQSKLRMVRSLLRRPYRIFYYPDTSPLQIFAIIHGKRDPLAVLTTR